MSLSPQSSVNKSFCNAFEQVLQSHPLFICYLPVDFRASNGVIRERPSSKLVSVSNRMVTREQKIPIFRDKCNYAVRAILLEPTLNYLRPDPLHTQSLLFKDSVEWLGTLGCLCRSDSGMNVIHLEAY